VDYHAVKIVWRVFAGAYGIRTASGATPHGVRVDAAGGRRYQCGFSGPPAWWPSAKFRSDLSIRMHVLPISKFRRSPPPPAGRSAARHPTGWSDNFVPKFQAAVSTKFVRYVPSERLMERLVGYSWPGNSRRTGKILSGNAPSFFLPQRRLRVAAPLNCATPLAAGPGILRWPFPQ